MVRPQDLLCRRAEGLYCAPGGFYIDPVRPVDRAVVTHGHSDHARSGHGAVLATPATLDIMRVRYGDDFAGSTQPAAYGEVVRQGEVEVTLVPAGHVLGSAQAVVEWRGLTVVVSGDYKRRPDPTCQPFEPVGCDVFVTEATFGLPVFAFRRRRRRSASSSPPSPASRSARTWSGPMRSARRSASSACCDWPATTRPSTSMARWPS